MMQKQPLNELLHWKQEQTECTEYSHDIIKPILQIDKPKPLNQGHAEWVLTNPKLFRQMAQSTEIQELQDWLTWICQKRSYLLFI